MSRSQKVITSFIESRPEECLHCGDVVLGELVTSWLLKGAQGWDGMGCSWSL